MRTLTPYSTPRWLRRSLGTWRRPSLARWTLAWTLSGVILGCSAIPDVIDDRGGVRSLEGHWSCSRGVPLPAPDGPEDDAIAIAQPLPEPGLPGRVASFVPEDSDLPLAPSWVRHLRPATPDVLGVAPKTGPPSLPPVA